MKSRMRSTVRCLVYAMSVISLSVGAADVAKSVSKARADEGAGPLTGFLTLESIMLVSVVLLALVVIARKRKAR